jgi:hypothetical protein
MHHLKRTATGHDRSLNLDQYKHIRKTSPPFPGGLIVFLLAAGYRLPAAES